MLFFFGTSRRSALFLDQAIKNGLKVDLVVSGSPKPIGKKQILTENPTVTVANKYNIRAVVILNEVKNPAGINGSSYLNSHSKSSDGILHPRLTRDQDDTGIILDFNKIIPAEIINLFSKGIINIHFSKLPQYKGPSPVQFTILNGDKEAWITYYLINEKVDAGLILKQTSLTLDGTENTEILYQKLIAKSTGEVNEILSDYLNGKLTPTVPTGQPSITHKLTLENCKIDWSKSPAEIDRLVRASYPEPGAWSYIELQSKLSSRAKSRDPFLETGERDSSTPPISIGVGRNDKHHHLKILKSHLENGKLILDQVQLEGKNPVTYKQFQQGYPNFSLL